ncbi:MAG: NYN domain-containing protein [Chlorobaculum sp.]|nr:NYN domain-containing protein [Chlorobaculum sp.]
MLAEPRRVTIRRFLFFTHSAPLTMNRVSFIIDGFNLYHSLKNAQHVLGNVSSRWLNIHSLCAAQLFHFGRAAVLSEVYYISAYARHLEASKPDVTKRHQEYVECLQSTGVIAVMNRFKRKDVRCRYCHRSFSKFEEKETDVMIATKLFELLHADKCDTAVLVTGDTDLAPAIRTGTLLFPSKKIVFAFPFGTKTKELSSIAPGSFSFGAAEYAKHQFAETVTIDSGKTVSKPLHW